MTWDQQEADAVREDLIGYDYHARARIARLEVALAKYARHLDTCDVRTGDTCTCGLRRALEKP